MLIYIDNTIADYLKDNRFSEQQVLLFSSLAIAYRRGKCIIAGNLQSLNALIISFGSPIDGIFRTIRAKYSENGSFAQWAAMAYIITCQEICGTSSKLPAGLEDKARYLSIEEAQSINWSLGSCLLAENLSDCEFYESIGKYYTKKHKIKNTHICFHREQGGGSDISSVLEKCVTEDAIPTLCLADSDIKFGSTRQFGEPPKGDTYNNCQSMSNALIKKGFGSRFAFPPIDVHEIENLVPFSALNKLGDQYCSSAGLQILNAFRMVDNGMPIRYYDFKNGITVDLSTSHGRYWDSVINQTSIPKGTPNFSSVVNNHFLERLNQFIVDNGLISIELDTSIDSYLVGIWEELGKIIFSWGCSVCPIRA